VSVAYHDNPPAQAPFPGGIQRDPWEHRSSRMLCASCMWFVEKKIPGLQAPTGPEGPLGRCRRHAPTLAGYPAVWSSDWCGDHKLDERKA
jgi:hypothetical protein